MGKFTTYYTPENQHGSPKTCQIEKGKSSKPNLNHCCSKCSSFQGVQTVTPSWKITYPMEEDSIIATQLPLNGICDGSLEDTRPPLSCPNGRREWTVTWWKVSICFSTCDHSGDGRTTWRPAVTVQAQGPNETHLKMKRLSDITPYHFMTTRWAPSRAKSYKWPKINGQLGL